MNSLVHEHANCNLRTLNFYPKMYYNLIIAMFFDVAMSLSNFNKETKKIIHSARLSPYPFVVP